MNPEQITEGEEVERFTGSDGSVWVRKWVRESPGLLHLVWTIERPAPAEAPNRP